MKYLKTLCAATAILNFSNVYSAVLIEDSFESTNHSARGWYDGTSVPISNTQQAPDGNAALEFHFQKGSKYPTNSGTMRKKFSPTKSVFLKYYVKYSDNWEGSNRSYHPHEFLITTDMDNDWVGPSTTHLTAYIEQNEGKLSFNIQDALNIDSTRIGSDLTNVTENRAVAGCNGSSDGYPGDCYLSGSTYKNEKIWRSKTVNFSDSQGENYKNDWHVVEAYFRLNDIVNGKGINNGIIKYWFDGNLVFEYSDILFRTGAHPDMMFTQLIIGPYIGDGSPVDQTFWVDKLMLADEILTSSGTTPNPPSNLRVIE
jgi:hypothetical protein